MSRLVRSFFIFAIAVLCAKPLIGTSLTAQQVYSKVKGSVYTLYSFDYHSKRIKARGTAVAVGKNTLATNCHVALSGNYLIVKVNKKPKVARLVYKNEKKDLCILKLSGVNFTPVPIRGSNNVKIGEVVYAIGNPKGTEKSLSKGIISNKHKVKGGVWLQTDAAIYYGSSGGGLFDEDARLIGLTTKMGGNFGFAMPTEWILTAMSPTQNKEEGSHRFEEQVNKISNQHREEAKARRGLSHIGTYGRNEVGLYRNNRECFIMIPGRSKHGQVSGVTLWNPRYPRTMVIFPSSTTAKQALKTIYKAVADKRNKKQHAYRSSNTLFLAGHSFRLYGTKTDKEKYPFFVARFDKTPIRLLMKVQQFAVEFKDSDPRIGEMKMLYQMDGFEKALKEYKASCSSR